MRVQWTLIFALIFAFIIALFAVVNVASVPVNFIFIKKEIPLILVVLGSTVIGGLIIGLFGIIRQYRLQHKNRGLQNQVDKFTAIEETQLHPKGMTSIETPGEASFPNKEDVGSKDLGKQD